MDVYSFSTTLGVSLPPPVVAIADRYKPGNEYHKNGAYYEQKLAYMIYKGEVKKKTNPFEPAQIVLRWGDKMGTNGADIISVDPVSGQVTLWDSKYRAAKTSPFISSTFKSDSTREAAIDQARGVLQTTQLISGSVLTNAITSLNAGNVNFRTVLFDKSGSIVDIKDGYI